MGEFTLREAIILLVAACGIATAVLSFLPWVNFVQESDFFIGAIEYDLDFSLAGTDVSRIQGGASQESLKGTGDCTCQADLGDGYLTALFGATVVLLSIGALILREHVRRLMSAVIVVSLAAFAVSGYNAIAIWEGYARPLERSFPILVEGTVQAELYALMAASAAAAVLGSVVIALSPGIMVEYEEEDEEADSESILDEMNGWA